jgi:hypothetical protein
MHSQFSSASQRSDVLAGDDPFLVSEMILQKPGAAPVYGCRMFSQEVFVQTAPPPGAFPIIVFP